MNKQEFKEHFNELSKVSKDLVSILKRKKSYDGFMRLFTEVYPDNAHFIYELLQNAEDANATNVIFNLYEDRLEFNHDGTKQFEFKDIESITAIGESTKVDDPTSIGKFGIGFKAVFAYSASPEIHTSDVKFRIKELVINELIEYNESDDKSTYFIFPFNNPNKVKLKAFAEINTGLMSLDSKCLLFLKNISKISININNNFISQIEKKESRTDKNLYKIIVDNKEDFWLLFHKDIKIKIENKEIKDFRVSIAFSYDKEKNEVRKVKGKVCIYFPCSKEESNLKFHIHAPFASTVARDSVKDVADNTILIEAIADLAAESLLIIKEKKLLTTDFLAVLPNCDDELNEFYSVVQERIYDKFINEDLLPMQNSSYSNSISKYQGDKIINTLLNDEDLSLLLNKCNNTNIFNSPVLVKHSNNEDRINRFYEDLGIDKFSIDDFIQGLKSQYIDCSTYLKSIKKGIAWHQNLYTILNKNDDNYQTRLGITKHIVLLNNGEYALGCNCFFETENFKYSDRYNIVNPKLYTGTKNDAVKDYLKRIGVKNIGLEETVQSILKDRYSEKFSPDIKDMELFIKVNDTASLKAYRIFKCSDDSWQKGSDIYIDSPFEKTELKYYFQLANEFENTHYELNSAYNQKKENYFQKVIGLLKKCDGIAQIEIQKVNHFNFNPEWNKNQYRNWSDNETNYGYKVDYYIPMLDYVLKNINKNNNGLNIAKLLWLLFSKHNAISYENTKWFIAAYKANAHSSENRTLSTIAQYLKIYSWVPQKIGNEIQFLKPSQCIFEKLPDGFTYENNSSWLEKIQFGKIEKERREALAKKEVKEIIKDEEQIKKEEVQEKVAHELGFDDADELKEYAELKQHLLKKNKTLKDLIGKELEEKTLLEIGINEIESDTQRRSKKVIEAAKNALKKDYIILPRSVDVNRNAEDSTEYLKALYTINNIMKCQLCNSEMPFKKRDKNYYFEKIEILNNLPSHHHQLRLALCPNCSALYTEHVKKENSKLFIKNIEYELLKDELVKITNLNIKLKLDNKDFTLHIKSKHKKDMKDILKNI